MYRVVRRWEGKEKYVVRGIQDRFLGNMDTRFPSSHILLLDFLDLGN